MSFYPGGPMDLVAQAVGIEGWPARPANPAMVVHLPDGLKITRWADGRRWPERLAAFGPQADSFWRGWGPPWSRSRGSSCASRQARSKLEAAR